MVERYSTGLTVKWPSDPRLQPAPDDGNQQDELNSDMQLPSSRPAARHGAGASCCSKGTAVPWAVSLGRMAQLVERSLHTREVAGSSPAASTTHGTDV